MSTELTESVPCTLIVHISKISNLPKLGRGGSNPLAVLEVINPLGTIVVGGEREIDCKSSMSRVQRNTLDCEINTYFSMPLDTKKVRSLFKFRCRVMDFQQLPEKPRPIGFIEVLLADIAKRGGDHERLSLNLLALGDLSTSGGKGFKSGEELRGYKEPTLPSVIELAFEMKDPGYTLKGLFQQPPIPTHRLLSLYSRHPAGGRD
jgi:hypothetical protein